MILVTGGAGFIGSNLIRKLNLIGYRDIIIVDNLKSNPAKKANIINLNYLKYYDKYEFLKLLNLNNINYKFKVVFHLGACSSTTNFDKDYMIKNNFEYSKSLLNWSQNNNIPFIYASSASVYGQYKKIVNENTQMNPLNPYALSKKLFDDYVLENINNFSNSVVGLRYFNVYGPNEFHKKNMSSPLLKFREQLLYNNKIKIFGKYDGYDEGEHSRDFISVEDCVNINIFFYQNLQNGIYNVGTGISNTFNLIGKLIIEYYGKGEIEYISFPDILQKTYQSFTQADKSKLVKAGYSLPLADIKKGLNNYMNYLDTYSSKKL